MLQKNNNLMKKFGRVLSYFLTKKLTRNTHLFNESNKEVYYAIDNIIKLSKNDILFLKEKANNNERKRCRICTHKDASDKVHEMFIVLAKDAYVRPHKHLNKCESLHILEGLVDVVIFDKDGKIVEVIKLGDYSSGNKFYYRISDPYFHTLLVRSNFLVFHEITNGPFNKTDTIFAPWAPDENDNLSRGTYMEKLKTMLKNYA